MLKKIGVILLAVIVFSGCSSIDSSEDSSTAQENSSQSDKKYSTEDYKTFAASIQAVGCFNDKVANTSFCSDRTSPWGNLFKDAFYLYFDNTIPANPIIKLRAQYFSEDWLFVESYLLNADGETYSITPEYGEQQRDNGIVGGGARVWEWINYNPTEEDLSFFLKFATAKSSVVRYLGKQYYSDFKLTSKQKKAFFNTLTAYKVLSEGIVIPSDISNDAASKASADSAAAQAATAARVKKYVSTICSGVMGGVLGSERVWRANPNPGDYSGSVDNYQNALDIIEPTMGVLEYAQNNGWDSGKSLSRSLDAALQNYFDIVQNPTVYSAKEFNSMFNKLHYYCK